MHADAGRIVVHGLTKNFGALRAVDSLSFTVEPGSVTGFLGPNGAGKTTTLRMLLGLVRPSGGQATIGGQRYADLGDPLRTVGAALEAASFHPSRSGRNHIRVYCAAAGVPSRRADEVLTAVGLSGAARRRVREYSLGMRQRLSLATALLGDPRVLILDEPANGLDPEGIAWLRGFLRLLASQGRTVLVSSHVLSEVEQTVDRVVIVARGRLVWQGALAELTAGHGQTVVVHSPGAEALAAALHEAGARCVRTGPTELRVAGLDAATVGHHAFVAGVEVHELRTERPDLEQVFIRLTSAPVGPQVPPGPDMTPPVAPGWGPPGWRPSGAGPITPATAQPTMGQPGTGQPWVPAQPGGGVR
ncbi:MAG TPA: ABC transporter ATP-binding protein [Mycobacteriales bacterium]|jgi:ABC-type multidrug transport system, ATPase component